MKIMILIIRDDKRWSSVCLFLLLPDFDFLDTDDKYAEDADKQKRSVYTLE